MGHSAHRLSIEWSRIEPRPGEIDAGAVAHYREVLEKLRDLGITPMVTLHHFTNPRWLAARGGWEDESSIAAFRDFARLCAREYGDLVQLWITINEPNVYAYQSYLKAVWPPQKKDFGASARVQRNLLRAHAAAYQEIKTGAHGSAAMVGVAQHLRVFQPWRGWLPLDRLAAALPDMAFNYWFLRGCTDGSAGFPLGRRERVPEAAGTMDYVGVNYYSRDMVAFSPRKPGELFASTFARPGSEVSDVGMEIYPAGLNTVIQAVWSRYHKPIYVTENGVADRTDRSRPRVLVSHIAEMARAHRAGADVRGYLHWTSMDNFEWAEGYSMRFGLQAVDFSTQARKPRASARLYSRIIEQNGLLWSDLQEHYPAALPHFVGRPQVTPGG
jgi:beta-glucosidase